MVRIRMRRVGARRQPYYRIVVADQRKSRDGRFIEEIGHYDPRTEPETVKYDKERIVYWLSNGAQPSESVDRFLKRDGIYDALDRHQQGTPLEELFADAAEEAEEEAVAEEVEVEETEEEAAAEDAEEEEAPAAEAADEETEAEAETVAEVDAEAEDAEEEAVAEETEAEDADAEGGETEESVAEAADVDESEDDETA